LSGHNFEYRVYNEKFVSSSSSCIGLVLVISRRTQDRKRLQHLNSFLTSCPTLQCILLET